MNTSYATTNENSTEDQEAAAGRHAGRVFLFLLYSLNALVIAANIQVWGDLFGLFNR